MIKWIIRVMGSLGALFIGVALVGYFYFFGRPYPDDPADALISYEDLTTFVSVLREAQLKDDIARYADYLAGDTKAVGTYVSMFDMSADAVAMDVHDRPATYENLIARTPEILETEPEIRAAYEKFRNRYREAVFPPVYVLYGHFHARALIRPYGLLFGGEYFVGGDRVMDLTDPGNLNGLMNRPEKLTSQIIHELAHVQQARKNPLELIGRRNLLRWSIREGDANFVAKLITGKHTNSAAHAFLVDDADKKWCAFFSAVEANQGPEWLDQPVFAGRPRGLGPAFGYRIVEAYYESSGNKDAAFEALVELADYRRIYEESGFRKRLATMCG